jgi:hypothetical protein
MHPMSPRTIVPRSWLETEEMSMVIGAPRSCVARFFELLEAEYGNPRGLP